MELKYIVPIAGVVLGWLLSQLSGVFTLAREDRRSRAASLPAMIDLYFQQYRINKILEFFNLRLGDTLKQLFEATNFGEIEKEHREELLAQLMASFEVTRQGNIDLPEKQKESLFKSLSAAVESLSKVAPASAYRLSRLSSEFALFQEIKFSEKILDPMNYLVTHGNILGVFRADLEDLRRLIVRTALGLGVIQFLEVFLLLRSEEKKLRLAPKDQIEALLHVHKPNTPVNRTSESGALSEQSA